MNMSEWLSAEGLILAMGIVAIVAVVELLLQIVWIRRNREYATRQSQQIQSLQVTVNALATGNRAVVDRIAEVAEALQRIRDRQQHAELLMQNQQPVSQATSMLENGASTEELVSGCGLSPGEADLINHLYLMDRAKQSKPAA